MPCNVFKCAMLQFLCIFCLLVEVACCCKVAWQTCCSKICCDSLDLAYTIDVFIYINEICSYYVACFLRRCMCLRHTAPRRYTVRVVLSKTYLCETYCCKNYNNIAITCVYIQICIV